MSRPLQIRIPRVDYEVDEPAVDSILAELERLKRDGSRLDPESAIEAITEAQTSRARRTDVMEWPAPTLHAFARALDHLRSLHPTGPEHWRDPFPLANLRDITLGACGFESLTYEIDLLVPDRRERKFWSYTGEYEPGDRLVRMDGEQLRVLERRAGTEHDLLICERWEERRS